MKQLVGLMGAKGAGKDTCAQYLVEHHGFVRIGFADALYREVAEAFGVSTTFLGNRNTKELELPELALIRCREPAFVTAVGEELEKLGAHEGFNSLVNTPRSPRFVLQLWGTEFRRRRGIDSYWLDIVHAAVAAQPHRSFVVTDVRFHNEADFIENQRGLLIRIRRPALELREAQEREKKGRASHDSETELLGRAAYRDIENIEGDATVLREAIFSALGLQQQKAA